MEEKIRILSQGDEGQEDKKQMKKQAEAPFPGPDQEESPGLDNFTKQVRAYQKISRKGESIAPRNAGLLADQGGDKKTREMKDERDQEETILGRNTK